MNNHLTKILLKHFHSPLLRSACNISWQQHLISLICRELLMCLSSKSRIKLILMVNTMDFGPKCHTFSVVVRAMRNYDVNVNMPLGRSLDIFFCR